MRKMTFHKTMDRYKLFCPPVDIDKLRIALLILPDDIRAHRVDEMDNRMPAAGELITNHGFSGTGGPGDAAHHKPFIALMKSSFSQSSPMLTRM